MQHPTTVITQNNYSISDFFKQKWVKAFLWSSSVITAAASAYYFHTKRKQRRSRAQRKLVPDNEIWIGTRTSALAMWQAEEVNKRLHTLYPDQTLQSNKRSDQQYMKICIVLHI